MFVGPRHESAGITDRVLVGDNERGAGAQGGEGIEQEPVEGGRHELQVAVCGGQCEALDVVEHGVGQAPVGDRHPLRHTRGPGGEHDVRDVIGPRGTGSRGAGRGGTRVRCLVVRYLRIRRPRAVLRREHQ